MQKYRSHKVVEAAKIEDFYTSVSDGETLIFDLENGEKMETTHDVVKRGHPNEGDYLVRYEDGYLSWSPAKAFEEGYTLVGDG